MSRALRHLPPEVLRLLNGDNELKSKYGITAPRSGYPSDVSAAIKTWKRPDEASSSELVRAMRVFQRLIWAPGPYFMFSPSVLELFDPRQKETANKLTELLLHCMLDDLRQQASKRISKEIVNDPTMGFDEPHEDWSKLQKSSALTGNSVNEQTAILPNHHDGRLDYCMT